MNLYFRLLLLMLRSRRDLPTIWDTARTSFHVLPTDLDLLGHMNNGKYCAIMDVAGLELLRRSGLWAGVRARGWYVVVASSTITYRKSLRLGQRFSVESRVLGIYRDWNFIEHTFSAGSEVVARGFVRIRFLRKGGGSVPQAEVERLAGPAPADRLLPEWVEDWTESTRVS